MITFKNPYLGNTCVPFQHWACSYRCATDIEVPAREEQIAAARELDRQYDAYIRECHKQCNMSFSSAGSSALRLSHHSTSDLLGHHSHLSAVTEYDWQDKSHKKCCVS